MAVIIVEGPDGSGKSTSVAAIKAATDLPVFPTMGPPKNPHEIIQRVKKGLSADEIIFDRFSLISEMVYGPVLRDTHIFDPLWLGRIYPEKYIVVYNRPPYETLIKNKLESKPHKTQDLVTEVKRRTFDIVNRYDFVMGHINHKIIFDRTKDSLEELCAELTSRLADLR